jgi:hypothetical protein
LLHVLIKRHLNLVRGSLNIKDGAGDNRTAEHPPIFQRLKAGSMHGVGRAVAQRDWLHTIPFEFDDRLIAATFVVAAPLGCYEPADGVVRRILLAGVPRTINDPTPICVAGAVC